jgi:hypothetical protein
MTSAVIIFAAAKAFFFQERNSGCVPYHLVRNNYRIKMYMLFARKQDSRDFLAPVPVVCLSGSEGRRSHVQPYEMQCTIILT